jgi:hypothetical protein
MKALSGIEKPPAPGGKLSAGIASPAGESIEFKSG